MTLHTRARARGKPTRTHAQTAQGVYFTTFNARVDRLTVLKPTFPEELFLTSKAAAGAPQIMTVVAFR